MSLAAPDSDFSAFITCADSAWPPTDDSNTPHLIERVELVILSTFGRFCRESSTVC